MLTDRIKLVLPTGTITDPEDYLSISLGVIFPDDITSQHGDASCPVIYTSPIYGDIFLQLADPKGEESRRRFSHHLWNSGVQLAALIEGGVEEGAEEGEERQWSVRGEVVLELGAGAGLAGIVAAKAGAREVFITDYPAEEILANLRINVERNLGSGFQEGDERDSRSRQVDGVVSENVAIGGRSRWWVVGHEWGVVPEGLQNQITTGVEKPLQEEKGKTAARTITETETKRSESDMRIMNFPRTHTRVLCADCLWMPWQHSALRRSISYFLHPSGRAWIVAGFHTGRQKIASFFDSEALSGAGLELERIWERNAEGRDREWVVDRGTEDVTERKRWLVIAVLKRWLV